MMTAPGPSVTKESRKRSTRIWWYHFVEGWSFQEIADEFEISRQRAHRLTKMLEVRIGDALGSTGFNRGEVPSNQILDKVNDLLGEYDTNG